MGKVRIIACVTYQKEYSSEKGYLKGQLVSNADKSMVWISNVGTEDVPNTAPLTDTVSWSVLFDLHIFSDAVRTLVVEQLTTPIANANAAAEEANAAAANATDKASKAAGATSAVTTLADAVSASETIRTQNEQARKDQESSRQASEITRNDSEQSRVTNETSRQSAEADRVTKETARQSSETTRQANETSRQSAEADRVTKETARQSSETTRQANETLRVNAESLRVTAETARESVIGNFQMPVSETLAFLLAKIRTLENQLNSGELGDVHLTSLTIDDVYKICGQKPLIEGSGAPSDIADFIGQKYHDITNKKFYEAFGTSSISDWIILN